MGVRLHPSAGPHRALADPTDERGAGFKRAAAPLRASAGLVRRFAEELPARLLARRVGPSTTRSTPRALRDALDRRWLAPVALFVALGLVTALVLIALPASSTTPRTRAHTRPAKPVLPAVAQVNTRARAASRPQPRPPTPVSATLAAQLQASGHELLEAGRYTAAIQTLERAVTATGERVDDCLEPSSETCLTYAYALYDLGHALALSGHPSAAVGVLQRRLQIDNQRPVVQNELTLARTHAG
jgi:tetratricopeptide (TPR) repeat protein